MENPHNSQDLFELLKKHLAGKRFVTDAEVK
jgi:erythromycin esterase-like protein